MANEPCLVSLYSIVTICIIVNICMCTKCSCEVKNETSRRSEIKVIQIDKCESTCGHNRAKQSCKETSGPLGKESEYQVENDEKSD